MALLVGSALLIANTSTPAFTVHDKPYYADPAVVAFVRPGLVFKIVSAQIAADGAIRARFKLSGPEGLPLDRSGVTWPRGALALAEPGQRTPPAIAVRARKKEAL
jgi:hypothetical protein